MATLTVHSCAKINLTLDVLARRPDGYHELRSLVHTVGLWDTLHFDFGGDGFIVDCDDARLTGNDNLILKSQRTWLAIAESRGLAGLPSMQVRLEKRIPLGAGLGGGSGNAAATLLALNHHHKNLLSQKEMLQVAAQVGADVPLFLQGGCMLMEGIGERLTALPALTGWLVIVQPPSGCSTPAIFKAWDALARPSGNDTAAMLADQSLDLRHVAATLGNDLSFAAREAGLDVAPLRKLLLEHGALGAQMTGSGSAVFGIFASEDLARTAASNIELKREILNLSFVAAVSFCDAAVRFSSAACGGLK